MFRSLIFVFFQIFIFQLNFAFAQSKTEVIAEGDYIGNKSQTTERIEKEAIEKAKRNALANAGIKEHIKSTSTRRTETNSSSDSENISFNKSFTSSFSSEMQGAVTEYEIIDNKHSYNENGLPICYVKIKATVIEYENDADYNFKAIVDGFEPSYSYDEDYTKDLKHPKHGHSVSFNCVITKDSYLTIFATWADSVALLYPNDNEDKFNSRNEGYKFKKKEKHFSPKNI